MVHVGQNKVKPHAGRAGQGMEWNGNADGARLEWRKVWFAVWGKIKDQANSVLIFTHLIDDGLGQGLTHDF